MKIFSVIWIPLMFMTGCNDDTYKTIVRGVVLHDGTREPIEGVRVILKDGVGAVVFGQSSNTSSDKRAETYTDENGRFKISLSGEHTAYMGAGKEGYFCFQVQGKRASCGQVVPFGDGRHEDVVVELDAEAAFSGVFYSKEAIEDDILYIRIPPGGSGSKRVGKGPFKYEDGLVRGDKYLKYELQFTRNGDTNTWHTVIDSVYVKSFETYTDTIYY